VAFERSATTSFAIVGGQDDREERLSYEERAQGPNSRSYKKRGMESNTHPTEISRLFVYRS